MAILGFLQRFSLRSEFPLHLGIFLCAEIPSERIFILADAGKHKLQVTEYAFFKNDCSDVMRAQASLLLYLELKQTK